MKQLKTKYHAAPNTMSQTQADIINAKASINGFTLVEIIIVVMIIGLLAALAIPTFRKSREDSMKNTCINNLRQMTSAKELAAFDNSWSNTASAGTIGNPKYRNIISQYIKGGERPMCPTGSECFYNGIDKSPTCESGISTHLYNGQN